jgi:hypothetical protein
VLPEQLGAPCYRQFLAYVADVFLAQDVAVVITSCAGTFYASSAKIADRSRFRKSAKIVT